MEALTVALAATGFLTGTTLTVNIFDLLFGKGLRVSLSDLLFSSLYQVSFILTIRAASASTLGSTDLTASETLAIKLETPTFGAGALICGFLNNLS